MENDKVVGVWGVGGACEFAASTPKVSALRGRVALHDDRLISAALVAEADRLIREGKIVVGRAE